MSTTKPAFETPYPPMDPNQAAAELGVSLSQKMQPALDLGPPKRIVTRAEAQARGWAWYWDGASACRYSHVAARRTANPRICSDCARVKNGEPPVYPKSRAQSFYELKPKDSATAAASAAPLTQEPTKKQQNFLAALARTGSFATAVDEAGFAPGEVEAQAAGNETFRNAWDALCDRHSLPRAGGAPNASKFEWTLAIKERLTKRFIDLGLLHTARDELGIAASDYWSELERDPAFAAAIEEARPKARETLRDRAAQLAQIGKTNLMELLDKHDPDTSSMSQEQAHAELARLLDGLEKRGLLCCGPEFYQHKKTGEVINLQDFDEVQADKIAAPPVKSGNADLVGAA